MKVPPTIIQGMKKVKTTLTFELIEAAGRSGVPPEEIKQYIISEWVNPNDPQELKFDVEDIARIQLIWDLKEQLGVNDDAVPIILHLIDELNHLHLNFKKYII